MMANTIQGNFNSHFNFGATPYDWEADWRQAIGETESERWNYVVSDVTDHYDMDRMYLDKAKLSRLPIIQEPLPMLDAPREDVVAVIPIYRGDFVEKLHKVFFKSALWVMRSFLKHTDILDHNIRMCLFIEKSLREEVRPYLEACGLDEEYACIFFENEDFAHLTGQKRLWTAKTYLWRHSSLMQYEYIFYVDSDIMVRRADTKHNIFERYLEFSKPVFLNYGDFRPLLKSPNFEVSFDEYLNLIRRAIGCSEDYVLDGWKHATRNRPSVSGKYAWFPIQWFHQAYPHFSDWIRKWAPLLVADEEIMSAFIEREGISYENCMAHGFCSFDSTVKGFYEGNNTMLDLCFLDYD